MCVVHDDVQMGLVPRRHLSVTIGRVGTSGNHSLSGVKVRSVKMLNRRVANNKEIMMSTR